MGTRVGCVHGGGKTNIDSAASQLRPSAEESRKCPVAEFYSFSVVLHFRKYGFCSHLENESEF